MGGAQYGSGALRKKGKTAAYYNTLGASYSFQAGVQSFSYALFFMNDKALRYLENSEGWEIGVGPSVVVLDEGTARTMTTTSSRDNIYAFIFGQKGLMAGAGTGLENHSHLSKQMNDRRSTERSLQEPQCGWDS